MITERLGKWLYPRWQPFRRRRQIRALLISLLVGLFVAGVVTGVLLLANSAGN